MKKRLSLASIPLLLLVLLFYILVLDKPERDDPYLEYVSMWNEGEPQANYFKEMAARFELKTNIHVSITYLGRDVLNELQSRILVGDVPDLIDQDLSELSAYLLEDKILAESLTSLMLEMEGPEGQEAFIDIYNRDMVDLYRFNGEYYFLPYSLVTSGFFYDKKLFEKVGIKAPKNWAEFMSNNHALKREGIFPLVLDGNINFYNAYYYYWACLRVLGPGALKRAATDPSGKSWDDPGYLKAAKMVYELSFAANNHFQYDYRDSTWPVGQNRWAVKGIAGSLLCGTWVYNETASVTGRGFKFGFYPFPVVAGGKGSLNDVEAYFIGFSLLKNAPHKKEAIAFMRYLMQESHAGEYVAMTKNISARSDIAYPMGLSDVKKVIDGAERFHISYDGIMANNFRWSNKVFFPLNDALIFGKLSPGEFIKRIKAETIDFYKEQD